MTFTKIAVAAVAMFGAIGVQAAIIASNGTSGGALLTLTSTGDLAGSFSSGSTVVATETGGSIMSVSTPDSTRPRSAVGNYLSDSGVGTTTLTFASGTSYLSFLWGTPDTYNVLTVNGQTYHSTDFGFVGNGVPGTGGYVQFMATGDTLINTVTFSNNPTVNAFETANFTITPVPEPETYALMLGGLGVLGFIARRRRGA